MFQYETLTCKDFTIFMYIKKNGWFKPPRNHLGYINTWVTSPYTPPKLSHSLLSLEYKRYTYVCVKKNPDGSIQWLDPLNVNTA